MSTGLDDDCVVVESAVRIYPKDVSQRNVVGFPISVFEGY